MKPQTGVRLLVGVASGAKEAPYPAFLESLPPFFSELSKKYDVKLKWVVGQRLDVAQNEVAQYAIDNNYPYILMLEDDHWGHTVEMVEKLFKGLDTDHPIVASLYHSRHHPYLLTAMYKHEGEQRQTDEGEWTDFYTEVRGDKGYEEADLVGFGMMLICTDLFKDLERPYFRFDEEALTTDMNFCKRLTSIGFKPLVCMDYILPHRDLTSNNVLEKRLKLAQDRTMFKVWKVQQRLMMNNMTGIKRIKKFQAIAKRGNADIKDQLKILEDLVVSTGAMTIVEIGTRKGVSTSAFVAGAIRVEKRGYFTPQVYTVDVLDLPIHWWSKEYEKYLTRLYGDSRTITIPEVLKAVGIDILFIDSSHLKEQTEVELERWGKYVNEGGLILMHDNLVCEVGVDIPAKAYAEKNGYEYITDDRQCGMGIMFVDKKLRESVLEEAVA